MFQVQPVDRRFSEKPRIETGAQVCGHSTPGQSGCQDVFQSAERAEDQTESGLLALMVPPPSSSIV